MIVDDENGVEVFSTWYRRRNEGLAFVDIPVATNASQTSGCHPRHTISNFYAPARLDIQAIRCPIWLPLDDTKLPGPSVVVNKDSLEPSPEDIRTSTEKHFSFAFDNGRTISTGLEAEVPLFSPVSGGSKYGRTKSDKFTLICAVLQTTRSAPSSLYLSEALQDHAVKRYCEQHFRPSVYLVTGVKVAHEAEIQHNRVRGRDADLTAHIDATSMGVPLKGGPSLGGELNRERGSGSTIEGPFILAYQLKRLRLKKDGAVKKTEGYTQHALFSDTMETEDDIEAAPFQDLWEEEDVFEDTLHEQLTET